MTAASLELSLPRGVFKPGLLGFGLVLKKKLKCQDFQQDREFGFQPVPINELVQISAPTRLVLPSALVKI